MIDTEPSRTEITFLVKLDSQIEELNLRLKDLKNKLVFTSEDSLTAVRSTHHPSLSKSTIIFKKEVFTVQLKSCKICMANHASQRT